jgi:hypothetical protein
MSIFGLNATPPVPALAAGPSTASSAASGFGATLQSALAGQTTKAADPTQTAYQTEPGRGASESGRHHRHHHGSGSMDTNGTQTAGAQGDAATSMGQASPHTSGGLLLSDMRRGLQAYGATTPGVEPGGGQCVG